MEDHGTVYETRTLKMREQIEAMKEIWTKDVAEYHGQIVDFPPMNSWPKPVQQPHPPIIVGGAFRLAARRALRYGDGILPAAPSAGSGSPEEFMPRWRQMAEEAGRDPRSLSVTLGGAPEDLDLLKRNRDLRIARMNVRLPPAKTGEILPLLGPLGEADPAAQALTPTVVSCGWWNTPAGRRWQLSKCFGSSIVMPGICSRRPRKWPRLYAMDGWPGRARRSPNMSACSLNGPADPASD